MARYAAGCSVASVGVAAAGAASGVVDSEDWDGDADWDGDGDDRERGKGKGETEGSGGEISGGEKRGADVSACPLFLFGAVICDVLTFSASQFSPSRSPSPVVAQEGCRVHTRRGNFSRWRRSRISSTVMDWERSCLLANISRTASCSSRAERIRWSSMRASWMRSRSCESMTKISALVPVW